MKRTYQELEMEIILLDACDILTLSLGAKAANADEGDGISFDVVVDDLNDLISGGK
jgi:hypothetical protein